MHNNETIKGADHPAVLDPEFTVFNRRPYGFNVVGFEAKISINLGQCGRGWHPALQTGGVLVGEKVRITLDIAAGEEAAQVAVGTGRQVRVTSPDTCPCAWMRMSKAHGV